MTENEALTEPHAANGQTQPRPKRSPRMALSHALVGVLFAVGFSAVSLTIDATHWKWFPIWIQRNFDYYEAQMDEFDVLFLGSSFTKRQIDPRVFDRELARSGHSIRSINLATLGMSVFGSDLLARRILSLQPKRLKWIVIDVGHFGVNFMPGSLYTNQVLWWHTPGQTAAAVRATFARELPARENLFEAGRHLAHFFWRFAHLGMGTGDTNEALLELPRRPVHEARLQLRDRGFMPHRGSQSPTFLDSQEDYESTVREARRAGHWPSQVSDVHLPFLLDQARWLRRNGVEPVYIVPPIMKDFPGIEGPTNLIHLFRYNDPEKYPQLFAFEARRDRGHLLEHAARDYTRLLARDFATVYTNLTRSAMPTRDARQTARVRSRTLRTLEP